MIALQWAYLLVLIFGKTALSPKTFLKFLSEMSTKMISSVYAKGLI